MHESILSGGSVFFQDMFTIAIKPEEKSEELKLQPSEIAVNGVDGDILHKLISYLLTGTITIDSENVEKMIAAASMFQFTNVEQHCVEFYLTLLSVTNCLGIRDIAELYNVGGLKRIAHAFILKHFVEVSKCDQFLHLSADYLSELLNDDEIDVAGEEEVFDALDDLDQVRCQQPKTMARISFGLYSIPACQISGK